jgi:class 3 adenylate cyclase
VTEKDRVPTEDDAIGLGNVGVRIAATILYADLTDSTGLVKNQSDEFAAEVYKSYVYAAARAIRHHDGAVTAYDGDRVMGVFMGDTMRNNAVEAAFHVSAIVEDIIQPQLDDFYGVSKFTVRQKIGIDQSNILVANTGIRGNNDYVWVGRAANNAAKMAAFKKGYSTYASSAVYSYLKGHNLNASADGHALWTDLGTADLGMRIYGANARKVNV